MRIIIDARMMGPRWTGIGLYTQKLVEQLGAIDDANDYVVLVSRENFEHWTPPSPNFTKVLAPYGVYSFTEQILLPFKLWRLKPDLVHFLHNVPVLYRGRRVVIVHDTTMVDYDLAPAGLLSSIKYRIKRQAMLLAFRATASANMIITPSAATKQRLLILLKRRIKDTQIRVIHEAIDYPPPQNRKIDVNQPTLLYVGTLFPFKNISVALVAMSIILKTRPGVRLKIIGSTPRFNQSVRDQVQQLGIASSVELAGFVSDDERNRAYLQASLFVFPSLSEGFGLPPLEAMGRGLPVLAAKASALPEVLASGADYFDPDDPKDLADKIEQLLAHPDRLAELQQRGYQRLKDFSWNKMAAETLKVYKEVFK